MKQDDEKGDGGRYLKRCHRAYRRRQERKGDPVVGLRLFLSEEGATRKGLGVGDRFLNARARWMDRKGLTSLPAWPHAG